MVQKSTRKRMFDKPRLFVSHLIEMTESKSCGQRSEGIGRTSVKVVALLSGSMKYVEKKVLKLKKVHREYDYLKDNTER